MLHHQAFLVDASHDGNFVDDHGGDIGVGVASRRIKAAAAVGMVCDSSAAALEARFGPRPRGGGVLDKV
jgi:hypothetical protein